MDKTVFHDMSYGMYVITTKYEGRNIGCFVNTVTQITSENPIISISLNKNNYTTKSLSIGKRFAVSILSEKTDAKVIGKFGFFSSKDTNKFDDIAYQEINEIPVLDENISSYLIAEVINSIDVETHNIILARVIDAKRKSNNTPMTYAYYHNVIKGTAPKTAPTYIEIEEPVNNTAKKYRCIMCGYIYDETKETIKFKDLPEDWVCPLCGVGKDMFEEIKE